jgi:HEAT repeat protein
MAKAAKKDESQAESWKVRPWVALFGATMFLLSGATVLYLALFQGFVVKRMGEQFLPHFFVLAALATVISSFVSVRVLRGFAASTQGAVYLALSLPAAAFLAISEPHITAESPLGLKMAFVAVGAAVIAALVQSPLDKIKVAMTDALPAERFKQIEPKVTSISYGGIVLTGLFLVSLGVRLGLTRLFWLAAIMTMLALPLYLAMAWRIHKSEAFMPAAVKPGKEKGGWLSSFSAGSAKRAVTVLAVIAGLTVIFGKLFTYEFLLATGERFSEEAQVTSFLGGYYAVAGLAVALFITGLRRFLLSRFGLTRNLHVPTIMVTLGVLLTIWAPSFVLVVIVVFVREIIMTVQQYSFSVMLQSVGDRQRSQAWSWIDGPVGSIAGMVGSLLLFLLSPNLWGGAYGAIRLASFLLLVMLAIRLALTLRLEKLFPDMLVEGLRKGDFKTRVRTMALMDELKYMRHNRLGAVLDVLRDETEPAAIRLQALRTLGRLRDSTTLRVIAKLITNPDQDLRREAIKAISKFDFRMEELYQSGFSREYLIGRLRELFRDEGDPETARAILDALIALRDEEAIPLLANCLDTEDDRMKRSCLLTLRRFRDAAVIDEVQELLDSDNPAVRADAIAALWQFSWERPDKLVPRLEKLMKADRDSDEYRWGLYLVGELNLGGFRKNLRGALASDNEEKKLVAGISLLKLGDVSGLPPVEKVLAEGTDEEAERLANLINDPNMPEASQVVLEEAIHRHHLHYPPNLPVTEPLRRRLADISKDNLSALLNYYPSPIADDDRVKLKVAIPKAKRFKAGQVALFGLTEPWLTMAAVHLLSYNYQVRVIANPVEAQADETVVADEHTINPPPDAVLLSDKAGEHRVIKSHFAPSELRRAIEMVRVQKYL